MLAAPWLGQMKACSKGPRQATCLDCARRPDCTAGFRRAASAGLCARHRISPNRSCLHPPACRGATPRDFRVLPKRIFLVRHAESEGNVDNVACERRAPRRRLCAVWWRLVPSGAGGAVPTEQPGPALPAPPGHTDVNRRSPPPRRPPPPPPDTYLPDPRVPLTARGWQQAMSAGDRLRAYMDSAGGGKPYKLFFYPSPYLRSRQVRAGGRLRAGGVCRGGCGGVTAAAAAGLVSSLAPAPPACRPRRRPPCVPKRLPTHLLCRSHPAPSTDVRGAGAGV